MQAADVASMGDDKTVLSTSGRGGTIDLMKMHATFLLSRQVFLDLLPPERKHASEYNKTFHEHDMGFGTHIILQASYLRFIIKKRSRTSN